jgi:succinyl-CoA synthetase beta subunit
MYEYQAKEILARYSIPIPRGQVCSSPREAAEACLQVGPEVAVKAQVLSGGRGRAGGIKFARSPEEARSLAEAMLGSQIGGLTAERVLVEERLPLAQEYYLGVMTDTDHQQACPLVMVSRRGGMEIEDLVREDPDLLRRRHIDPRYGLHDFQALGLLQEAQIPREWHRAMARIMRQLYQVYWEMDGEMVEINPLVVTTEGRLVAADARMNLDNNALFRHPEVERVFLNPFEARAAAAGLSYAHLDGNIGIMANGAGLGMATMDAVKLAGGQPANFLDPGIGFLEPKGILDSLRLLRDNSQVEVILINVFGGGIRCDLVAAGLLEALDTLPPSQVPIVACLRGRNEEVGLRTLAEKAPDGVKLVSSMEEAVQLAVELGGKGN